MKHNSNEITPNTPKHFGRFYRFIGWLFYRALSGLIRWPITF